MKYIQQFLNGLRASLKVLSILMIWLALVSIGWAVAYPQEFMLKVLVGRYFVPWVCFYSYFAVIAVPTRWISNWHFNLLMVLGSVFALVSVLLVSPVWRFMEDYGDHFIYPAITVYLLFWVYSYIPISIYFRMAETANKGMQRDGLKAAPDS